MKVLLTGSTGFIGTALLPMLREAGHDVYELVRYVSGGRYDYYDREQRYFADLRDREAVRKAVIQCQPEVIIHLAAQTAVSFSFLNPVDVMETNFVSVVNLAEIAREVGVKQFIHASTSEVYGKAIVFPIQETNPLEATSPYAIAKIAGEKYLWLIHEIYSFPVTIMRPFNSFGRAKGGISNRHYVIERAICQALLEKHIHLHNPDPVRDFLFRDDHCLGYVKAVGQESSIGQAINLCTMRGVTIKQMTEIVADIASYYLKEKVEVSFDLQPDRPKDIDCLIGSNIKAGLYLSWYPHYSLEQALEIALKEWKEVLHV